MFAPFALTIACSVLVSLLISFSRDPMLSAIWYDPQIEAGARGPLGWAIGHFNAWFDRQRSVSSGSSPGSASRARSWSS